MKAAFQVTIVCALCNERVVSEHSVAISEIGKNSPVRFCPECYAMFCDFRTALQLMRSTFVAAPSGIRSGGLKTRQDCVPCRC